MKFRLTRFSVLVLLPFLNVACIDLGLGGNGSSASAEESEEDDEPPVEGEEEIEDGTCNAWKVSYCDAVEQCESFSDREECENDVGFIDCLPDAPFARCQSDIDAALRFGTCADLPGSECTPEEIADRTRPFLACMMMHEEICEWQLYCGLDTNYNTEACVTDRLVADPCAQYYAVWPGIESCLEQMPRLGCQDVLPDVCLGILRK